MAEGISREIAAAADALAACWAISDGAAGMVSQVRGLAQAVGLPFQLRTCSLKRPFNKLWPGVIPAWPSLLTDGAEYANSRPRLAISCGRQSVVGSRVLKQIGRERIITIHTQDPKVPLNAFDLIMAPEHDGLEGKNVLATRGAVHHVTAEVLHSARQSGPDPAWQWQRLSHPIVAVLIGGTNRHYEFTPETLSLLIELLHEATRRNCINLVILPSRRTPPEVADIFRSAFGKQHFVWDGRGANPYLFALASARHVVVTGDSVSMVSEATATGRPVHIYHLPQRRHALRLQAFHASFESYGYTRRFEGRLDEWTYTPPNETARVAGIIRERLARLGEPVARRRAA